MDINIKNAADMFFPNPSLESVYFEAVANSMDANAGEVKINIHLNEFSDVSSFTLEISDNGDGFNDRNFHKFSSLLEVEEKTHKGLGRLVFLQYFDNVEVTSYFENKLRQFQFDWNFDKSKSTLKNINHEKHTFLKFSGYTKSKIKGYDYVLPDRIRENILRHFFPRLYKFKLDRKKFRISINLTVKKPNSNHGFVSSSSTLDVKNIPDLQEVVCETGIVDLISEFKIHYSVKQNFESSSLITAVCVDDRTINVEIISKKTLPPDYEMIFLMYSDYFSGKTNVSRDALELDEDSLKKVQSLFRQQVSMLINLNSPDINKRNEQLRNELNEKYPHLQGYFEDDTIGLIEKEKTVEGAQKTFFNEQRHILEASSLDEIQLEKSLDVSSRLLAEYILYRTIIIEKLKKIDHTNNEAAIHNLIVPKKKIYHKGKSFENIFSNNAWLLDDKYMTYTSILSDREIKEIYTDINIQGDHYRDHDRPDITVIFSSDPKNTNKVDVVIVELKKLGLNLAEKIEIIVQLRERARVLLKYYPQKIQRIWFYGIVDFDEEFTDYLIDDKYIELFSTGSMLYKEQEITIKEEGKKETVPIGVFIQSYQSFLDDAAARNSTFLKILKEGIKSGIKENADNLIKPDIDTNSDKDSSSETPA